MKKRVALAGGFRPFFLFAGIDAIFNMALWLAVYAHPNWWLPGALPAIYWHGHEMLFGFVAAAIGGFLLTAVPGWTGRKSYAGAPLAVLSAVWLAGRVAMFPFAGLPEIASTAIDLAFFPALVVTLTPPLVRARKLRNLPFVVLLAILFAANLLFHLGRLGFVEGGEFMGLGLAVNVVMVLIVVIGGRIVPAFTRSGLESSGTAVAIVSRPWLDIAAIATIVAVFAGDVVFPDSKTNGAIALVAALVQAARLAQWRGIRAWRDPLIWVLHLGYGWLVIGLALKGVWLTTGADFAAKWLHALTAGAFATMILAVMTRASLGHTGRALMAPVPIAVAYLLVSVAAAVRVFGPAIAPAEYDVTILLAGACWIAAFTLFIVIFAPILTRARIDGRSG